MSELKPCPFCGSLELKISPNRYDGLLRVQCEGCWATSVTSNQRAVVIAAWNARPSDATPPSPETTGIDNHSGLPSDIEIEVAPAIPGVRGPRPFATRPKTAEREALGDKLRDRLAILQASNAETKPTIHQVVGLISFCETELTQPTEEAGEQLGEGKKFCDCVQNEAYPQPCRCEDSDDPYWRGYAAGLEAQRYLPTRPTEPTPSAGEWPQGLESLEDLLSLADEIEAARNKWLNHYGTLEGNTAKNELATLLLNNKGTFPLALRHAALTRPAPATGEALKACRAYFEPRTKYKDGANYSMENEESKLFSIVCAALAPK